MPTDPTNEDRSRWAEEALGTFIESTRVDPEQAVQDLLTDLMHYCDRNLELHDGLTFDQLLEHARGNYDWEVDEEQEENPQPK